MVIILLIVLVIRPNRIHLIFIIYSYIIILFAIKKITLVIIIYLR